MKKKTSRILSITLATILTAALVIPAIASTGVHEITVAGAPTVYMDGKLAQPKTANGDDVETFLLDGTTYYPLRALSEYFGSQVTFSEKNYAAYVDTLPVDDKAAEYLEVYFGITADTSFNDALTAIFGDKAVPAEGNTVEDAVVAAINSCGLKEMPAVYSVEEAAASTVGVEGLTNTAAVAAALDTNIASGTWNYAAELDSATAAQLLMNAANSAGLGRKSLGCTTDPDIAAKMRAFWSTAYDFTTLNSATVDTMWNLGKAIVDSGATTGFGVKSDKYNANFLEKYTIQYSHDSINHAVQLVTLLAANDVKAYVALEPKISIYDWESAQNNWVEYDLKLEFATLADRDAFQDMIINHVSRGIEGNTEAQIVSPYWTPLYSSQNELEGYLPVDNNLVKCGQFILQSFTLKDNTAAFAEVVNGIAEEYNAAAEDGADLISYEDIDIWVNVAFVNYLNGEHN